MAETFDYDVFLSHSSKDKAGVRPVAERLRGDGLRVWLDEWEIKAGDSIPAKISPARVASFAITTPSRISHSWAMWEYAINRLLLPMRVAFSSEVETLIVMYSLIVLLSPMTRRHFPPLCLRS